MHDCDLITIIFIRKLYADHLKSLEVCVESILKDLRKSLEREGIALPVNFMEDAAINAICSHLKLARKKNEMV